MNPNIKFSTLFVFIILSLTLRAQTPGRETPWYAHMPNDTLAGTGIDSARHLLQNIIPGEITVAIIDAGVDVNHIELKNKLWTNPGEIPNNGMDEDSNGYFDDVHGWNFLGNDKGENLQGAPYEYVRIYDTLRRRFDTVKVDSSLRQTELYRLYDEVKTLWEEKTQEYKQRLEYYDNILEGYVEAKKVLNNHFGNKDYELDDIKKIEPNRPDVRWARNYYLKTASRNLTQSKVESRVRVIQSILNTKLNFDYHPRELIGDDLTDLSDRYYGNNDYAGGTASHGTGAAGIIAAANDSAGITGIAPHARIMPIRAIPGGDEWDKDVALAIRYAVDQGADIISGSFGKMYSPNKHWVDSAIRYAAENNVLIVVGAGNDHKNNDIRPNYPNAFDSNGKRAKNFISVGASDADSLHKLAAGYSNYGKKTVDIFAPGTNIPALNTGNRYRTVSGTSAATPVVAGIAAMIWSRYPELKASQLREIISRSVTDYSQQKVLVPGANSIYMPFSSFCRSGGVINAVKAVEKVKELYKAGKLNSIETKNKN